MTGPTDHAHTGEEPEPAPQQPEEPAPPEEAAPPEPGAPELPEPAAGGDGTAEPAQSPAPTAPKKRRSRNRGRHHQSRDSAVPSERASSNGAGQDAAARAATGDSPGPKVAHGAKRPVPARYGPLEAAFFDLDKTVIAKASMVAFGRPFYHGGLINRRTVLRALYGGLVYLHLGASEQKLNRIRESVLRLIKGWHRAASRDRRRGDRGDRRADHLRGGGRPDRLAP